jgi:intracellular sulfur oxidation DsrE/DsrF family protein
MQQEEFMKKLLAFLMMAVFTLGAGAAMAGKYSKQKVVYHVNYGDEKRQGGALRNMDIRVVMHSAGYKLLTRANKDPNVAQKIQNLKDQGVKFNICANTLRGKKINYKNDMYDVDEADIVPSGVAEIAHLEDQGFSYIRP